MYRLNFQGLVILIVIVAAAGILHWWDYRRNRHGEAISPSGWARQRVRSVDWIDAVVLILLLIAGLYWSAEEFGVLCLYFFLLYLLLRLFVQDAILVWFKPREGVCSRRFWGSLLAALSDGLNWSLLYVVAGAFIAAWVSAWTGPRLWDVHWEKVGPFAAVLFLIGCSYGPW